MESAESKWLKSIFQETQYDGDSPHPKRMKFSEVSGELQQHFPYKEFTPYETSRYIQEAFPNTESRRCGKARQTHLLGLERKCTLEPVADTTDLLMQIQQLKCRIAELEKKSAELEKKSEEVLCHQADEIIQHRTVVTQGPVSLEAFHHLDLDSIVTELRTYAPDLYHLCMAIGNTKRNQQKDEVTTEEIKVISSMCSLLNARSARVKGLQLLMGMMLVARGTSRQVCMHV